MSKTNEKKLEPKLRFPEFEKDGEWRKNRLDEIAEFLKGKGISKADIDEKGKLPCIRYGELYTHYSEIINEIKSFTNISSKDLILSEENDVIIPSSGETREDIATASCVKLKGVALGGDLNVLRSELDGEFLAYFLSHGLKKAISKIAQGDAVVHLYSTQLKKLNISVPPLKKEQKKIAACLSSLDDVITTENQKLELLKEHKKGLLQNLLAQDGETVPKFRFKEFNDSGEWVSDILKNVFTIFQGFAFSSNDSVSDGVRWLKIADVGIQKMNHLTPSYLPYEFKEKYENFLVKEGDYVIALTRPILNKKLKISKVDNTLHESLLNQRVGKLVSNKCIDFVYYLIQTSKLISSIEQNIAGSEPPNLSAQQIENIEVFIPPTMEEQQKIAVTFSSIDDLINIQSQKVEALKLNKKGLLQGLFPNITEINE